LCKLAIYVQQASMSYLSQARDTVGRVVFVGFIVLVDSQLANG